MGVKQGIYPFTCIVLTLDFNYHNPSGVNYIYLGIEAVHSIIPQCVKSLLNIVRRIYNKLWHKNYAKWNLNVLVHIVKDREIVITNSLARDKVYPTLILWYVICLMLHWNAESLYLSN